MKSHYTHPYLIAPMHKISVDLVGLGGTGSIVLGNLGRMNKALQGLNHPGLHVRAWDPDKVTAANEGRQLFSAADRGQNKASVLITRINRFFGTEWQAMPRLYTGSDTSNILITCVDTAKARLEIAKKIAALKGKKEPVNDAYYWLDIGNLQKTGQCIIGTIKPVTQPKGKAQESTATLPNVVKKFPQLKSIKEINQGPSCSLAEALQRQDLFINSTLSQFACNILWNMLREGVIRYHGCFVNLETLSTNPIKIM